MFSSLPALEEQLWPPAMRQRRPISRRPSCWRIASGQRFRGSGHDLHHLEPGFSDHAMLEEWEELVSDFITAAEAIVAAMNVEDILHGTGQGP